VELFGRVLVNYAGKGEWQELYRMEGVRDGDGVCTGPDGEVSLKCKDDTLITLFPLSGIVIEGLSVETRDGGNTAVARLALIQGRVDITPGASDRYESDLALTVSDLLLASGGDGRVFSAAVEYNPETETVGIAWRGGEGTVTVPGDFSGIVEVAFGVDSLGTVSFFRNASAAGELIVNVRTLPVDTAVSAVIDRIVVQDGGRIILSGRTYGNAVSLTPGGEETPVDAVEGFWETELAMDAGASFSPEPIALGPSGDLPDLPAGTEDTILISRGGDTTPGSSVDGARKPPDERRDVSRIARSFLDDFIDAVEDGDTTALSGLIDPSYSGIGGSRSGLVGLVREYFNNADTLRISWSVVSIDKTEDVIITTISWSSSAGASGVSTFWLSDGSEMSLSHAEGDWFF
jgi:hypothetical protein